MLKKTFLRTVCLFVVIGVGNIEPLYAQNLKSQILGRWYLQHDFRYGEIDLKFHAVQEFFANGTMTDEGQVIVKSSAQKMVFSCLTVRDYSWSVSESMLYQKLLMASGAVDFIKIDGKSVDPANYEVAAKICDDLKGIVLKTQSFRIISIDSQENLYSFTDDDGKEHLMRDRRTKLGKR